MSRENVEEAFRQLVDGISNRDLALLQALSDPEIEYTSRFTAVEGKTYRGHAGWSDYLADLNAAWEDFRLTIEELIPAGEEKLVGVGRVKAVARGSSVPIDQRVYAAWEFRDNKAVRGQTCASRDEALKAAGLSEDRPSMPFDLEDFIRSGYSRFSAGERIPTLEYWHADGEFTSSSEDPDHATYRGIEAIQGQYWRWVESYPDLRVEVLELRVNRNRAFAWVRFSGHGAGSGVPIEMELAHVWTVEDGKIRRMAEFFDRDDGLEAAGLEE